MKKLTKKPIMINTPPARNRRVSPMMLRYKSHVKHNIIITVIIIMIIIALLILII